MFKKNHTSVALKGTARSEKLVEYVVRLNKFLNAHSFTQILILLMLLYSTRLYHLDMLRMDILINGADECER